MSEHVLYAVYWDNQGKDTYLYGSDIRFMPDRSVLFENLMMPAGMSIREWSSRTNFQADRVEPALPMLEPEREYFVRAYFDAEPSDGVTLKFDFYDQQREKKGTHIMTGKTDSFTCPADTYYYTAALVQEGAERIRFYRFEIFPAEDTLFYEICDTVDGKEDLTLFVPSAKYSSVCVFDEELPAGITDYMVLSPYSTELDNEDFGGVLNMLLSLDVYDRLFVYMQDEKRLQAALERGLQTDRKQFRLWRTVS